MKKLIILVMIFTTSCSNFVVPQTITEQQRAAQKIAHKNFNKDKLKRTAKHFAFYGFIGFGIACVVMEQRGD